MISDYSPQRIVSLVPSMTESLFDLGLGNLVVGITDYCIHPKSEVGKLPRLGGTKNPRIEELIRLHPDLVIANKEENSQESIRQIEQSGIPVWLTFPKSVDESITDLWSIARTYRSETAYVKLRLIEKIVEVARLAVEQKPVRYFCPIWYEIHSDGEPWWMTFNQDTYSSDLLSMIGGQNVFSERKRRYPLEADLGLQAPDSPGKRDERYPRVKMHEIITASPDVLLFPDEPYPFEANEARQLVSNYKAKTKSDIPFIFIEGSLITWPGTRIAKAITELAPEFTKLTNGVDDGKLQLSE